MNMANTLEAGIDERDISVAHRLPSRTASLQILKMMKTDEHITSAWTKEVNFQWKERWQIKYIALMGCMKVEYTWNSLFLMWKNAFNEFLETNNHPQKLKLPKKN